MNRKSIITLAKLAISLGLLYWIVSGAIANARANNVNLAAPPYSWPPLVVAWLLYLTALVASIFRWRMLVRALEIPFSVRDAFRLGFLGYMLNFVSVGAVGGDLFKAVFIAHEQKQRRTEAVASVLVDRVIGVYGLFIVASLCVVFSGLLFSPLREVRVTAQTTLACFGIGLVALVVMMLPGFSSGPFSEMMRDLPKIGPTIGKLFDALRMYRRRPGVLVSAALISVGVHTSATIGLFLIARGLFGNVPSLADHFLVGPLSMVASAAPLPFMGLGAFEGALEFLYVNVAGPPKLIAVQTLKIAIVYRLVTILNAGIGALFYVFSRREMAELMREAEALEAA